MLLLLVFADPSVAEYIGQDARRSATLLAHAEFHARLMDKSERIGKGTSYVRAGTPLINHRAHATPLDCEASERRRHAFVSWDIRSLR